MAPIVEKTAGGGGYATEFGHEELDLPMYQNIYCGDTDKPREEYRVYTDDAMDSLVRETYKTINTQQTVESVRSQHHKWGQFDNARMSMFEVLEILQHMVDESDPDTSAAQRAHAFQTAERCRELFPDHDFMHLVGLIHDAGKIIALWGQPQWATVGDTFPVGCRMAEQHTFSKFYMLNPDSKDPRYNTKHGIYAPHCGLDNVLMSFGHDEFLYQVLTHNGCPIPEEGLHIIRYHSFYAHHQHDGYSHLCNEKDAKLREWLIKFQIADLYSKNEEVPDVDAIMPYYKSLVEKYCPGVLRW